MSLATIKVDTAVRDQLAEVARSRHVTIRALLADLADQMTRDQQWADIYAAYAELQADPGQWAEYRAELDSWDSTAEDDVAADREWPEYQQ
jgi:hypothetical protein